MGRSQRSRLFGWLVATSLAALLVAPSSARTQPAAKPVTRAELERLDKKVDEQQRLIEKMVRLHEQYLEAMVALLPEGQKSDGGGAHGRPVKGDGPIARADKKPEPVNATPKADPKPEAKPEPKPEAKPEPKPTAKPTAKPNPKAVGILVGKVKGAAAAYVYVEDIVVSAKGSASMKQQGKQFVPQVLAVQKGTKVEFPNMDAIFHNVFSVTPDNSFDLGSYRQGESKGVLLTKPGVVSVYCNMHPQMVGHILVVPSSFYAAAGKDGFFRIANVPVGHHRVVAWAPNSKPVVSEVDVIEGEAATVELELKPGRASPHNTKEGLPYGSYKD